MSECHCRLWTLSCQVVKTWKAAPRSSKPHTRKAQREARFALRPALHQKSCLTLEPRCRQQRPEITGRASFERHKMAAERMPEGQPPGMKRLPRKLPEGRSQLDIFDVAPPWL